MSPRRATVVALVLVLFAGACTSLLGTGGTYEIQAEFVRTYNLFPGSPVRVLGVEVGKVTDLHTSPDSDVVLVDLLLEDDVALPADVTAVIIPKSLLGERYVQLGPPHVEGATLQAGDVIPAERTQVPSEFDEILESLNRFVGGLDEDEFARFISNLAEVLDGQGEKLGSTIDQAHEAIKVLRDNDDDLVALASRLADLNETLSSRDQRIVQLLRDWNTVAETIVAERGDLDRALEGLVRLTTQVAGLLESHRTDLQADIGTLTRVARTADRNIDELSRLILWGAELFRHAQRVVERDEHGWLPLVNHGNEQAFETIIVENLADRFAHLCSGLGLPADQCDQLSPENLLGGGEFCLEPLIPCSAPQSVTLADMVLRAVDAVPELRDHLGQGGATATIPDVGDAADEEVTP